MVLHRKGDMKCISIFTVVLCAAGTYANRIHGNKIIIYYWILTIVDCCGKNWPFIAILCTPVVPEIETNPSSLLVPIGTTAVFECKVRHCPQTCSLYWFINGSSTAHDHQQDQHEGQGFIFQNHHNTTTNVFYSKLAIIASVSVNSTKFYCIVQDGINRPRRSDGAILIVASG